MEEYTGFCVMEVVHFGLEQQQIYKARKIAFYFLYPWTQKKTYRIEVLSYLAEKFEVNRDYTEKEVNCICDEWHTFSDYFILRRELVDNGLLCREPSGSRYWKPLPADLTVACEKSL